MRLQSAGDNVLVESMGHSTSGTDPDIVALADGRLLMVWTETLSQPTDTSDDTDGAIFARILNSDGTSDGDIFQVNDAQTFLQGNPHVVVFPAGGFAIGWTTTATYGDMPVESDTFVKVYNDFGAELTSSDPFDIVEDNPAPGILPDVSDDQILHEMVALDSDRIALVLENGETHIYSSSAGTVSLLDAAADGDSDIAVLENGNIVRAGTYLDPTPPGTGREYVRLVLTDNSFQAPTGISGIYDPLVFYLEGSTNLGDTVGEVELAALTGGGFAVAFAVTTGSTTSEIRLNILTDEALKEFTGTPLVRTFAFDSPVAEFDMLSLSNGGFALALVTKDTDGTGTGIDILLYDADGSLSTRIQATDTDVGDQADPSLTQQPDGTVVLAYTDTSDLITAGETNGMRLAFFELDGSSGKFTGTTGDDFLSGVGGNDRIFGLGGNDDIVGLGGNDSLFGGAGNDTLDGGAGHDALRGGLGDDTLQGRGGHDGLSGGAGLDELSGGAGNDVLGGGADNDTVRGGGGHDVVKGGGGDDQLFGNNGDDVLKGHDGNDELTGGNGADTFVFSRAHTGNDTVKDFDETEDVVAIHLRGLEESSVSVSISGADTEISFGTQVITLEGVNLAEADITFEFI